MNEREKRKETKYKKEKEKEKRNDYPRSFLLVWKKSINCDSV
jgi:hypothetical protein